MFGRRSAEFSSHFEAAKIRGGPWRPLGSRQLAALAQARFGFWQLCQEVLGAMPQRTPSLRGQCPLGCAAGGYLMDTARAVTANNMRLYGWINTDSIYHISFWMNYWMNIQKQQLFWSVQKGSRGLDTFQYIIWIKTYISISKYTHVY
jgi:hypothetical protein